MKRAHVTLQALGTAAGLAALLVAAVAPAARAEEEASGEPGAPSAAEPAGEGQDAQDKPGPDVTFDGLAYGQYVLATGDGHKLAEDEGNAMSSGFIVDSLRVVAHPGPGQTLGFAAGLMIPEDPANADGFVYLRFNQLGKYTLWFEASRFVSFWDDSIGSSASAAGLYPSYQLGKSVAQARHVFALGATIRPCTCSRIDLKLHYGLTLGQLVPQGAGSPSYDPGGTLFEYPGLRSVADHTGGIAVAARWVKGGLGLHLDVGYRVSALDEQLKIRRPLDGTAFDGANFLGQRRLVHGLSLAAGVDIVPGDLITFSGGYAFGTSSTKPLFTRNEFGDASSVEYASGPSFGTMSHRIPLGLLIRPVQGLGLRLALVGKYLYGKADGSSETYDTATGALTAAEGLTSQVDAMGFTEQFSLSVTRLAFMDLTLTQRFELEQRDVTRAVVDLFDADLVDESRSEELALSTLRNSVSLAARFRAAPGLVIDLKGAFDHTRQDETIVDLNDWIAFGDSEAWKVSGMLRLRYRLGAKLTLWASGTVFKGLRWRPEVTGDAPGLEMDLVGFSVSAGVGARPVEWLYLHALYSYNQGDYEVGSAPLLGGYGPVLYTGRIHTAQAGLSIAPVSWMSMDAAYQLVLVSGSLDSVIHRVNAEARFAVYKGLGLGVGYLGRIFSDENVPDDDYGGHAIRVLLSGTF